jgi:protocatechuate 3,4-dioxygenase alpha subunit
VVTDFSSGNYWLETIKPGRVPDPEGELQAPHLLLVIQARGMLRPVYTRLYFGDEEEANSRDLIMGMVPSDRRATLVAQLTNGDDPKVYRFDVTLQGENETVFFDF